MTFETNANVTGGIEFQNVRELNQTWDSIKMRWNFAGVRKLSKTCINFCNIEKSAHSFESKNIPVKLEIL